MKNWRYETSYIDTDGKRKIMIGLLVDSAARNLNAATLEVIKELNIYGIKTLSLKVAPSASASLPNHLTFL